MPTLVRVALVVVSIAVAVVVAGPAPPAVACSCGGWTDAEAAVGSDAVFVGTLVDIAPPPDAEVMSSAAPATYTFTVTEVRKGEVAERQEIVTPVSGASCGLEIRGEGPFLVFATSDSFFDESAPGPGQYHADLCGGTRPLITGEDLSALGAARPPVPAEPVAAPAAPDASPTVAEDGTDRTVAVVVASAVAGSVALGLGAVMIRRRAAA